MKLNEKIIYSRKKAGMSQIDLADALGVSRQSVSKWETGESNPDITKLPTLAKVLNVSIDWLLSDEDPMEDNSAATDTAEIPKDSAYPEWVEHLPKLVSGLIKKFGWIYGVYIAIGGFVFTLFGIFARVMAHNFIFGSSQSFNQLSGDYYEAGNSFMDINNQAWSGFSAITGFVIFMGIAITLFGVVLAVSLKKWGHK